MSDLQIQKIDRKTKERARLYYFANYSLGDISSILNIDSDTLRFYVFGENGTGSNEHCWFQLKKKLDPASVAAYIHDKIGVLEKTTGVALNVLNENLKRIQQDLLDDPTKILSLDDTKKLASIVVDMDKIVRLESGQATQIVENIGLTRAEAIRVLAEDPFAQAVEVDEADWHEIEEKEIEEKKIEGEVQVEAPWKK
jgi:hypothetical protein